MTRLHLLPRRGSARGIRLVASAALAVGLVAGAAACAPEPAPAPTAAPTPSASASGAPAGPQLEPFPTGPSVSTTALPADCEALLTPAVRTQLEDLPLNAPGMGGGIRPDSTRVCVWGEPGSLGTWLATVVGYSPDREARDALFALGNEGYTCYEPRGGVRCERTWPHPTLPVEQGRTLFYRDGVIIDTQYSNLAPEGFTTAVVSALWPDD